MDVVIPYQLVNKGFELRYCLRSLEKNFINLGNVFIVGDTIPEWLTDIIQIPAKEGSNIMWKDLIIHKKTLAAIEDKRVSDSFLFANDDHFLLKQHVNDFPYYYSDILWGHGEKAWGNYKQTLLNTRDIVGRWGRDFDCHCPIIYNKVLYKYATLKLDWRKPYGYAIKSVYCAQVGIEGEYMEDCKIREPRTREELIAMAENRDWFSTSDKVLDPTFRKFIMELYPEPSRFENLKVTA